MQSVPASSLAISLRPGRAAWKTNWHNGAEESFLDHFPQLLDPGLFCLEGGGFQDNPLIRHHRRSTSPDGEFAFVTLNVLCHSSLGSLEKYNTIFLLVSTSLIKSKKQQNNSEGY